MIDAPKPKTVTVCDTCGEDWQKHVDFVQARLDYDEAEEDPTVLDCIAVLKGRNIGPMGPPGATGPTGMSYR